MKIFIWSEDNRLLVCCEGDPLKGIAISSGVAKHAMLEHELGHDIGTVGVPGSGCNLELDNTLIRTADIVTINNLSIKRL